MKTKHLSMIFAILACGYLLHHGCQGRAKEREVSKLEKQLDYLRALRREGKLTRYFPYKMPEFSNKQELEDYFSD